MLAFNSTRHENAALLSQHPRLQYSGSVTTLFVKATPTHPPLTFFFHAGPEAFVEPAETTLVPLILVHNALPAEPAQIQCAMMQGQDEKQVKGAGVGRNSSTYKCVYPHRRNLAHADSARCFLVGLYLQV